MKAHIHITLKKGVLDPQGKAIENALKKSQTPIDKTEFLSEKQKNK